MYDLIVYCIQKKIYIYIYPRHLKILTIQQSMSDQRYYNKINIFQSQYVPHIKHTLVAPEQVLSMDEIAQRINDSDKYIAFYTKHNTESLYKYTVFLPFTIFNKTEPVRDMLSSVRQHIATHQYTINNITTK